jgi:hypothetical protein
MTKIHSRQLHPRYEMSCLRIAHGAFDVEGAMLARGPPIIPPILSLAAQPRRAVGAAAELCRTCLNGSSVEAIARLV